MYDILNTPKIFLLVQKYNNKKHEIIRIMINKSNYCRFIMMIFKNINKKGESKIIINLCYDYVLISLLIIRTIKLRKEVNL